MKKSESPPPDSASSWMQTLGKHLQDKSLYALSFCSELLLTPDDTLLLSVESYGDDNKKPRNKALFQHRVGFCFIKLSIVLLVIEWFTSKALIVMDFAVSSSQFVSRGSLARTVC